MLSAPDLVVAGEMAVFAPGSKAITLQAVQTDSVFVLGSAMPHPYELALGNYSVHTNPEALRAGEQRIAEIGVRLREHLRTAAAGEAIPVFK